MVLSALLAIAVMPLNASLADAEIPANARVNDHRILLAVVLKAAPITLLLTPITPNFFEASSRAFISTFTL
jgi:hypothetical protein